MFCALRIFGWLVGPVTVTRNTRRCRPASFAIRSHWYGLDQDAVRAEMDDRPSGAGGRRRSCASRSSPLRRTAATSRCSTMKPRLWSWLLAPSITESPIAYRPAGIAPAGVWPAHRKAADHQDRSQGSPDTASHGMHPTQARATRRFRSIRRVMDPSGSGRRPTRAAPRSSPSASPPSRLAFVGSVADAYLEAEEEPDGRAIRFGLYDGDTLVGFVMLSDEVGNPSYVAHFLWKLLIDERFQHRGYGTAAIDLVADYFRSRGAQTMWTSAGRGRGRPDPVLRAVRLRAAGQDVLGRGHASPRPVAHHGADQTR